MILYIWKTPNIIPINKKGLRHLKSNGYPVSLTCVLCKVFGKLIRNHISNFIGEDMNCNQYGLDYGKFNISGSIDIIHEYWMTGDIANIYLDFSKAFDTVSTCENEKKTWIFKKKKVNIIRCFLTDRSIKAKNGKNYSEKQNIPFSVPQRSIPEPLWILTFRNDLPKDKKIRNKTICWWCQTDCKTIIQRNNTDGTK